MTGIRHSERIGFIGLGNIGKPMAVTLVKKGFDVTVYDLRKEPVEELRRLGARTAISSKEVGEICEIIIVQVLTTAQTEEVILGKDGVLESAKKGSLILIGGTVDPIFCQRVAKIAAEKEVGVLDTPVSGAAEGAEAATLTFMVGGERDLLERCRPVLESMGKNIFHIGVVGMGEVVKLANNTMSNTNYIGVSEGISLAVKAGVDLEQFLKIVQVSSGESKAVRRFRSWRMRRIQDPAILKLDQKDLQMALDLGRQLGVPLAHLEAMQKLDLGQIIKQAPV